MYHTDERGAVTVDWVVLTAGLVGIGFAVAGVVSIGVQDTSGDIKGQLESGSIIKSSFFSGGSISWDNIDFATMPDGMDSWWMINIDGVWTDVVLYGSSQATPISGWDYTPASDEGPGIYDDNGFLFGTHDPDTLTAYGFNAISLPNNGAELSKTLTEAEHGRTYSVSFDAVQIWPNYSSGDEAQGVDVYFGGELIGTAVPQNSSPDSYSFNFTAGSGDGSNEITFKRSDEYPGPSIGWDKEQSPFFGNVEINPT